MKTLYININGENILGSDDIIVVGTPDDNIVDKFYYELGKEIVKGIDAPGIRGLAKHIVKSYKDIDEMSFDIITKQWLKVKDKLLGENPTGTETIELPMEYVKWLQNYGDTGHTEIAKSLYARNRLVEICLDKIYRNSVNIIINSIESDIYGQFVVNDEVVTDDSAISIAIMNKLDGIAFKPYKKENVCQKCGKNPCECKKDNKLFNVILLSTPKNLEDRFIICKIIKGLCCISMQVAKDLVNKAPSVLCNKIPLHEANKLKACLEATGAVVEIEGKVDICPRCGKNPCECPKTCPKCGKDPCICNSVKEWSTAEDLKNGIITLAGITLNKTTIKELRAKGFKCERDKYNQFLFNAEINKHLSVYIPQCRYKDIDEIKNEIKLLEPLDIDEKYFINERKVVKMMTLEITSDCLKQGGCPFFRELGMVDNVDGFDYDEFIEMLEELGYTKVENPFEGDDADDLFVNNIQNTNNWVIVCLNWSWDNDDSFTITISFDVCFLNKLISYNTGETLRRDAHRRY